MTEPIRIWKFYDAPKEFQEMSINGGDEDYLAIIPPNYTTEYFPFLEGNTFGCCSVDEIKIETGLYRGYIILIGVHA